MLLLLVTFDTLEALASGEDSSRDLCTLHRNACRGTNGVQHEYALRPLRSAGSPYPTLLPLATTDNNLGLQNACISQPTPQLFPNPLTLSTEFTTRSLNVAQKPRAERQTALRSDGM